MLEPSPFPVLEFKVVGEPGAWMVQNIPGGILVRIPGWIITAGLLGTVLALVATMAAARTAKDWLAARRHLSTAVEQASVTEKLLDIPNEAAEEQMAEKAAKLALADANLTWQVAYVAWAKDFRDRNDRDPTREEAQAYVADNPLPRAEDYI